MLGFSFGGFVDETAVVAKAAGRAAIAAVSKTAYAIFRAAQASIVISPQPSRPGEPPHSRRGQLPRSIRYDVDKPAERAVVGPRASLVGASAEPEEFGGEHRGASYPERRFMGPALQANAHLLPTNLRGQVTNE